jgi:hypothetical protein
MMLDPLTVETIAKTSMRRRFTRGVTTTSPSAAYSTRGLPDSWRWASPRSGGPRAGR